MPLYSLGILIVLKVMMPNPNFPAIETPSRETKLFEHFLNLENHTVAVVPNDIETQVEPGPITYERLN